MSTIKLLNHTGIPTLVNKTFTTIATVNGSFRAPYNLMDPVIQLGTQAYQRYFADSRVTHMEIDGKFYFVRTATMSSNALTDVQLHLDVLTTYKTEIGNLDVILERSSNSPEKYLADELMPMSVKKVIEDVRFDSEISDKYEDGSYVLVTSQNGYAEV